MEPKRALVVEDEHSIQRELAQLVADMGLTVLATETLTDAIAAARATAFDLILVDLGLADGTGFELLRDLQSARSESRIAGTVEPAVIVVSSTMDMAARNRSVELGAQDFISKPFHHAEIRRRIERVLSSRGDGESAEPAAGKRISVVERGGLKFDRRRRVVEANGRSITLGEDEAILLEALMGHPSRTFSYSEISAILSSQSTERTRPPTIRRLIRRLKRTIARVRTGRPVISVPSPRTVRFDTGTRS